MMPYGACNSTRQIRGRHSKRLSESVDAVFHRQIRIARLVLSSIFVTRPITSDCRPVTLNRTLSHQLIPPSTDLSLVLYQSITVESSDDQDNKSEDIDEFIKGNFGQWRRDPSKGSRFPGGW